MYICQYCGKEVSITLYNPAIIDLEVCERCFENLRPYDKQANEISGTERITSC